MYRQMAQQLTDGLSPQNGVGMDEPQMSPLGRHCAGVHA